MSTVRETLPNDENERDEKKGVKTRMGRRRVEKNEWRLWCCSLLSVSPELI